MKLFEIIIKPVSGFGTPLKGDTLFGHICWQAGDVPDLFSKALPELIQLYHQTPFAVFSSAVPVIKASPMRYILKRPEMPLSEIFPGSGTRLQNLKYAKKNKKKKWMAVPRGATIEMTAARFYTDGEVCQAIAGNETSLSRIPKAEQDGTLIKNFSQYHNTINRLSGTTGTGMFAPYEKENFYYFPGTVLALLVLVNTDLVQLQSIVDAMERIGKWGFGRDATSGLGKFTVESHEEIKFATETEFQAAYTLAPCVPKTETLEKCYFKTFTRFGKHGARLSASNNPFKNPIIMADEAAVLWPNDQSFFENPYVGKAISGISKAMPETVAQGYAPYLPIKLEKKYENG